MNVFLIAAITADGFIARSKDDRSFDWTSEADKRFYVDKIKTADAIVMGKQTFSTFKRHPKDSTWVIYTREPDQFVNPSPNIITTIPTNNSPQEIIADLEKRGVSTIAICGGATIYSMFMSANLVDTLYLTVEPVLFGTGIPLFNTPLNQKTLPCLHPKPQSKHLDVGVFDRYSLDLKVIIALITVWLL